MYLGDFFSIYDGAFCEKKHRHKTVFWSQKMFFRTLNTSLLVILIIIIGSAKHINLITDNPDQLKNHDHFQKQKYKACKHYKLHFVQIQKQFMIIFSFFFFQLKKWISKLADEGLLNWKIGLILQQVSNASLCKSNN